MLEIALRAGIGDNAAHPPGSATLFLSGKVIATASNPLIRRQYISHSGLQESVRTRRGLQPMVSPLVKAAPKVGALATQGWRFLEAPNRLKIKKKGYRVPAHGRRYQNLLESVYSGALMPCREQAHDG